MPVIKEKSIWVKLPSADFAKLQEHAQKLATKPASVGSAMIAQGLRMISHPAIDFQETPDGRICARVAGYRISVWLVVETLKQCQGNKRKAAAALNLPRPLFDAAVKYADDYRHEIKADTRYGKRPLEQCRGR